MKDWPELMTVKQASRYLNVAERTLKSWIYNTRELPHVSLGTGTRKMCRVRKSVLDELIARGEKPVFRLVQGRSKR